MVLPSQSIQTCARLIDQAKSIAVLTGAGISTNAGIPDFRGPKGLYITRKYDADKIFDIGFFYDNPKPFYEFAHDFIGLEEKIEPTVSHRFLSALERTGKLKGVVTQNIDGLHHKAGSKVIYEMHGSFWRNFCLDCSQEFTYEELKMLMRKTFVPQCRCGGVIKPDIVFFGEDVKYYAESVALARSVDLFMIIGSSCAVYPAAMLPTLVPGEIIIINQGQVHLDLYNIALEVQTDADEFLLQVAKSLNLGE